MNGIFKNIGIIVVTSLLILATGGLPIFHHICHCAGETTASIYLEASCDHNRSQGASSCCNSSDAFSCCQDVPTQGTKHECHHGDCCETSSQFLKISDSFQAGSVLVPVKPEMVATVIVFVCSEEENHLFTCLKSNGSDLPPPEPGKKIVLAHHQLKLDPSLV